MTEGARVLRGKVQARPLALHRDAMGKNNEAAYLTKLLKENAVPSESAIEWARKVCRTGSSS